MALRPTEVTFVAGQDEGQSSKVLPIPRLKRCTNSRITKLGELVKIRGLEAIGATAGDSGQVPPVGPVRLFTHEQQLLAVCDPSLYTYSEAGDRWEELDEIPISTLGARVSLGHYGAQDVVACACAEATTFRVFTWMTASFGEDGLASAYQIHIQTIDKQTGAASAGTAITIGTTDPAVILSSLKAIGLDTKVTVFWSRSNNIYRLDITSPTSGPWPASTVGTSMLSSVQYDSGQSFDVANHGTGYVIARNTATGIIATRYNASHSLQATSSALAIGDDECRVGIVGNRTDNSATIHVYATTVSESGRTLYAWGLDDSLATQHSDTSGSSTEVLGFAAGEFDTARSQIVLGESDAGNRYAQLRFYSNGNLDENQSIRIPEAYPAGKPIVVDSQSFFPVQYYATQANSAVVFIRIWPGFDGAVRSVVIPRPEVSLRRGQGSFHRESPGLVSADMVDPAASYAFDGESVWYPLLAIDRFSGPGNRTNSTGLQLNDLSDDVRAILADGWSPTQVVIRTGVDGWQFKLTDRTRGMSCRVGPYTVMGGGHVLLFDGRRAVEMGFNSFPDTVEVTPNTSGGNMADGAYTYGFCWEWIDHLGNRHQSAMRLVSIEVSGGAGSGSVTIEGPSALTLTARYWRMSTAPGDARRVCMAIYRTERDGQILHRLEGSAVRPFIEVDPLQSSNAVLASIGTYEDTYNDSAIALATREIAYTSQLGSNELDNVPPPPSRIIVAHDDRVIGIPDDTPWQLWYSKQAFDGSAPAWNESLVIPLEEAATALASQDGNLIVFTARNMYTVIGRPADNTGVSTGYEPPQRIGTSIGCTNPRSVVPTPSAGTFFESDRGIYVLPRGGTDPIFVGKPVMDSLATYPIITSACHIPSESAVAFACVDSEDLSDTPAGVVLVYQYDVGQWFVREYAGKPVSSACIHSGELTLGIYEADDDITTWREDAGWDDPDGNFVERVIELGDLRLGGAGGAHTLSYVAILGRRAGVCNLAIREGVDGDGYGSPVTFPLTSAADELALEYQVLRRKGSVHSLELRETEYGTNPDTEGVALTSLTLWGSPIGSRRLLAPGQRG